MFNLREKNIKRVTSKQQEYGWKVTLIKTAIFQFPFTGHKAIMRYDIYIESLGVVDGLGRPVEYICIEYQ